MNAQVPGTKAVMSVKVRYNQEIDDIAFNNQCQTKGVETIGNLEYSTANFTPPFGKFVLQKYITKSFSL